MAGQAVSSGSFDFSSYREVKTLEASNMSQVFRCENKEGEAVCLKIVCPAWFAETEVEILKVLRGVPGMLQLFHYEKPGLHKNHRIYTELCPGGDLVDFQTKEKFRVDGMPEALIKKLFKQVLEGLDYLHAHGITHRDIKPENIYMMTDDEIKIGDFGMAVYFSKDDMFSSLDIGTLEVNPPEVVKCEMHNYTIDIWQAGVLLFTLWNFTGPFEEKKAGRDALIRDRIIRHDYKYTASCRPPKKVWKLIMHLMNPKISKRLEIKEALKTDWFHQE